MLRGDVSYPHEPQELIQPQQVSSPWNNSLCQAVVMGSCCDHGPTLRERLEHVAQGGAAAALLKDLGHHARQVLGVVQAAPEPLQAQGNTCIGSQEVFGSFCGQIVITT